MVLDFLLGTSGDVRAELGEPAEAEVPASSIARARNKATSVVNSYVEVMYPDVVPFTATSTIPEILHTIADDLSVYYVRRSKHPGPTPLSKDVKKEYYDDSINMLERISKGEVELPELASLQGTLIQVGDNKAAQSPTFNEDDELGWEVDADKLNDIADERAE